MSPETGRRLGPYEIQSRLGGGGMGHVFRAWDARLHREVAIKLLNHEYSMPGMRERFLREARAASALNHPNICTVFDIGEQDGDPYLVMELLEGETLKDRIQSHTLALDEIVCIARETAEALGAAHAKGVVHRDIKPANIFLVRRPNGGDQAKVLDFGLARIEGGVLGARSRNDDITSAGSTVGTLAYMSPEQARGEVLDSRSDLFSLGVVLYEMATRHVPFQGATSALVFVQLLNHPPEPVRDWNEAVPRELEKIIFKLLAKERTARFQTARELELALVALSEKGSGGGWLRKAVSAVPLVRAPDPIARVKRPSRPRYPGHGSEADRLSAITPARPEPPRPDAPRPETPRPEAARSDTPRPVGDQVLRPVVRVPRGDISGSAPVNPPSDAGVPSRFSIGSGGQLPRRVGDPSPALPLAIDPIRIDAAQEHASSANRSILYEVGTTPLPASPRSEEPAPAESLPDTSYASRWLPAASLRETTPLHLAAAGTVSSYAPQFPPLLELDRPPRKRTRLLWISLGALAILSCAALLFALQHRGQFASTLLTHNDRVVVTEIENRTGNRVFDRSVAEGLRVALAQSPWLFLQGDEPYRAVQRLASPQPADAAQAVSSVLARKIAERLNAKALLSGYISGTHSPYLLHVDLRDVNSNDVIASAEASANSVQQVAGAIDQIALDLRVEAGEPRASIDQSNNPLAREASANLAALQLFSDAQTHIASHESLAAVAELRQAVGLDPRFVQAHLRLAQLYHELLAETSAAEEARLGLAAADSAGERTRGLAQATYDLESSGDYAHATAVLRDITSAFPHDVEALPMLAETLVLQGHMAEALQNAQAAYTDDPFNGAAYTEAEKALIGLDRYDAAFQLGQQAERLGISARGDALTTAYLDDRQGVLDEISGNIPVGKIEYRADWAYGMYLDNAGHLAAGASHWISRAQAAQQNDSLKSAAASLLAQAAFDRALLGDCAAATAIAEPLGTGSNATSGPTALFHLGIAVALCGQSARANQIAAELQQRFPQSFNVRGFYLADIAAAVALHAHDPDEALRVLEPARLYDLISLTPFLRGLAHVNRADVEIGIVDLQTVLAHRGLAFLTGSDSYPAAQIQVARAFADSGDFANSNAAYRKFLNLWSTADPASPLVLEARRGGTR